MVIFFYRTGGQTNLVAVGAVAGSCAQGNLSLGQFAFQGLFIRSAGVAGTGDTHGLIYIAAAAQRIADGAAQTGGSTAEGFDFGGMVVGFVLEHHQPVFLLAVHFNGDHNTAGVDFFRSVQVGQFAFLLQLLGSQAGHIHQRNGPLGVFPVHKGTVFFVQFKGFGYRFGVHPVGDFHILQLGFEGGMTAVVGPIGIQHLDFRNGGIPVFLLEVGLDVGQVFKAHGQFLLLQKICQSFLAHFPKARENGYRSRFFPGHIQGFRFFNGSFLGFHRVDAVMFDFLHIGFGQVPFQQEHFGSGHNGTGALGNQLDALGSEIFPLVVLAGEQFLGKAVDAFRNFQGFVTDRVHRSFAEHQGFGSLVVRIAETFQVVPVDDPETGQVLQAQGLLQVSQKAFCFNSVVFFLFYKNSSDLFAHDSLQSPLKVLVYEIVLLWE